MVQFSTKAASPHDWPTWLPPPAAQQLAELECDYSLGSAFRKKILYGLFRSTGLARSSFEGFGFDSRAHMPERASLETSGGLDVESGTMTPPVFLSGLSHLSMISLTASEMYKTASLCIKLPFGQNAFPLKPVWQHLLEQ